MKRTKMQKGITLVALIITIVVLLILAVVAISAVSDSGIISHSKDAHEEYEKGKEKEKVTLAASEAYLAGTGKITEENLGEALDSNFGAGKYSIGSSNSEYFKVKITETGREYKVYINGKVEGPFEDNTKLGKATVGIKVEINSTIDGEMYSSENPIIPAGFRAINIPSTQGQESYWDAEGEPEVDKGLVIKDESGNEFVWVPVESGIIDENGYGLDSDERREPDVVTGDDEISYDALVENLIQAGCEENPEDDDDELTVDDFKVELTNMYKQMAKSVNKYGGFYVGRFETSKKEEQPQSRRSQAASGSGEVITSVNTDWYSLYALNKKYSTGSVQGSMMWGSQYNAMMNWMGEEAQKAIGTARNGSQKCGIESTDVIKNVYDLYGSCKEWTLEANGKMNRVFRGGSGLGYQYYYNGSAYVIVQDDCSPDTTNSIEPSASALLIQNSRLPIGSRLALYIK